MNSVIMLRDLLYLCLAEQHMYYYYSTFIADTRSSIEPERLKKMES